MRLGVLDIGSNTGHLLVVDAHRGAAPLPAYLPTRSRCAWPEHLEDGEVAKSGIKALTKFVADAVVVAEDKGAHDMLGFATSASVNHIPVMCGRVILSGAPIRYARHTFAWSSPPPTRKIL